MSQHKFACRVFKTKQAIWPGIVHQPVNAGSCKPGVEAAGPSSVDQRPH